MLNNNIIDKYEDTRNFPALDSTSRVGVHLRFGTLSLRNIVNKSSKSFNNTYLKELIWREFFIQILWHYPHTINTSFKEVRESLLKVFNRAEKHNIDIVGGHTEITSSIFILFYFLFFD